MINTADPRPAPAGRVEQDCLLEEPELHGKPEREEKANNQPAHKKSLLRCVCVCVECTILAALVLQTVLSFAPGSGLLVISAFTSGKYTKKQIKKSLRNLEPAEIKTG